MVWKALHRSLLCSVALIGVMSAGSAVAQQVLQPKLPKDPQQQLSKLDDKVLDKQRELFAARQHGDQKAVERLTKEFKEIQAKRSDLVNKTRHLY